MIRIIRGEGFRGDEGKKAETRNTQSHRERKEGKTKREIRYVEKKACM